MIETKFKIERGYSIPSDWDAIPLGNIGMPCMCKRVLKEDTSLIGEIPFFKIGTFGKIPDAYISRSLYDSLRAKYNYPRKGDVLISASGTIGRTVIFDGKDSYFQDSNIIWLDNSEKIVTNKYLNVWLQVIKWATTDGGTITRLYNNNIAESIIVVPSPKEQECIATALSDIDDLISSMLKLIDKKRNIKKGVMQELLSGKRRLRGFTEDWVVIDTLSLTGTIKRGQTLKSDNFCKGNIPVVAGGKNYAGYHSVPNQLGRTITISGSGANAGFVAIHQVPIFATDCSVIAESEAYSLDFLYYLLSFRQEDIYKMQTGGAQPHVYARDLGNFIISIPKTKLEQEKIAKVLSDMDAEIEQLESQLSKYEGIKLGMMQQLLTGKIRLV